MSRKCSPTDDLDYELFGSELVDSVGSGSAASSAGQQQ